MYSISDTTRQSLNCKASKPRDGWPTVTTVGRYQHCWFWREYSKISLDPPTTVRQNPQQRNMTGSGNSRLEYQVLKSPLTLWSQSQLSVVIVQGVMVGHQLYVFLIDVLSTRRSPTIRRLYILYPISSSPKSESKVPGFSVVTLLSNKRIGQV